MFMVLKLLLEVSLCLMARYFLLRNIHLLFSLAQFYSIIVSIKNEKCFIKANIVDSISFSLHSFIVGSVSKAVNGGLISNSEL